MSEELPDLSNFGGVARLFPLPNVVLFPHVMLPLHIFEPRYRQMTADALAGDRLLAIVLLRPGWEEHYEGEPAIHEIACLGRILGDQRLEDGRYNLLLRGLGRVRLLEEVPGGKLYRGARVEWLHDLASSTSPELARVRKELGGRVAEWFQGLGLPFDQIERILTSGMELGTLCDVLSFALPMPFEFKQELLRELDVCRRAQRLLHYLRTNEPPRPDGDSAPRPFPPDFSPN